MDVEGLGLTLGTSSVLDEASKSQGLVSFTAVDTSLSAFFFLAEDASVIEKKLLIFSLVADLYLIAVPGCSLK